MTASEHIGDTLRLERRIALILFGGLLLFMSVLAQFGEAPIEDPAPQVTTEIAE